MFTEIYGVIYGRVQGVGYRDFVDQYAREHGLTGWVQNKDNGTVELVLQGFPDDLKIATEELHRGSVLSKAEGVAIDWRTPEKQFDEFKVI